MRTFFLLAVLSIVLTPMPGDAEDRLGKEREVALQASFMAFAVGLDEVGLRDRKDPRHGFYVLTELEAFFLVCSKKERKAPVAIYLKPGYGTTIVDEQSPEGRKLEVRVRPAISESGESILLAIESPPSSAFQIDGKLEAILANGDVIYVPASGEFPDGVPRPHLIIAARFREGSGD
jgi:hypothetical protein